MNKKIVKVVCIVMAISLVMLTFAACGGKKEYEKTGETTTAPVVEDTTVQTELPANINPLTGLADLSDEAIGKRPVAIMVENSPAARPQWGLSSPDIVVEGVVEGGVTRMMWIYADYTDVPKVGPVRSARHDYAEIAYGMDALFVHWGWSKPAENLIKSLGMDNINGLAYEGTYFKRDTSRSNLGTEHTGYTDGDLIAKAIQNLGRDMNATKQSWAPFTVIPEGQRWSYGEQTGSCSSISVTFSSGYKHTFKYDGSKNVYYNYMNNSEMKDGNNNETMAVTNVIIMYTPVGLYPGTNPPGWKEWDLTAGDAVYVSNGYGESISWKKGGPNEPLKFYGKDGKELTVNRGKTWIGVVPEANRDYTTVTA